MTLREIPPRDPPPDLSKRALIMAAVFSAVVWALAIAALSRAFVRDIIP